MAYQVLARKWRPKKFADLVGQEHVVKALVNALGKGRLHHAYLLTGTRGVGKTTIARILAKSLNCPHAEAGEPCGVCDSCTQIDAGRYVDLLEIDAASNTGIDNIREVLENAQYAPTLGRYKVYIIDEVHMLSKSAFNAMLKTLEEPPEHVKFILATTDPHKVPITVLSRCLQFVLRNLNVQQVHDHLAHVLTTENTAYEDAALQLLGRAAMGSMRDALSLLDQAIAMGSGSVNEADVRQMIGAVDKSYLYDLLAALAAQNGTVLMDKAAEMAGRAIGFDNALSELALLLQRLALLQTIPAAVAADDPERARLQQLAASLSGEQIQLYYQCAIRGKQDLTLAPEEYAGFVMTLLRMLAFAPLAAAKQPANGQISGSSLQDAPPESVAIAPIAAPNTDAPAVEPVVEQHRAAPEFQAASVAESVPSNTNADNADIPPWLDTEAEMVAEAEVIETAAGENEANPPANRSAYAAAPMVESAAQPVLAEPQVAAYTSQSATTAAEKQHHAVAATDVQAALASSPPASGTASPPIANTEQQDEAPATLPELTAANWPQIVAMLAHKLGAVQLFAQHSAVAAFDAASGHLQLALASEGEITADKARLQRLAEVLSAAYGRRIEVSTEAWQQDSGLETQAMRLQRLQQEARAAAQQQLEADSAAQSLISLFGAQWLPESLILKEAN
ncbi:DNA polymerase III subunit gamma/tau [Paralysiella testudinis]|uniref:DNA polymerase III subunit gamma/tau n=1 Tax=Paralysiella testudinis TaxID=2809020 RepID=A0A892ZE43_9NEIS|nr:DNA polymerase III subunit gamma/tau [Paralysiella testudinis]QRQ81212.1 DNA polymerase III subunit gamma/tau [Paralysiella testudinis]